MGIGDVQLFVFVVVTSKLVANSKIHNIYMYMKESNTDDTACLL